MTAVEPVTLSRAAAEKLTLRIRQSGAELLTMVQEAHDRKAWASLGYKSWSAYVDAELPFSRSTSYRYLSAAPEQDALVAAGELSHSETNNSSNGQVVDAVDIDQRPLNTITPDAILPPPKPRVPVKKSERVATVLPAEPPSEPKNDTGPVPSLRQEASAAYRALHDAAEGIGAKWTPEEATYWENRTKREMDAWRKANRIDTMKPRQQGTISHPADRAPKPPVKVNGAPIAGSLTRREVTPLFKP